jgi:hypothetical protein
LLMLKVRNDLMPTARNDPQRLPFSHDGRRATAQTCR